MNTFEHRKTCSLNNILIFANIYKDIFVNVPSQWETMLHCNQSQYLYRVQPIKYAYCLQFLMFCWGLVLTILWISLSIISQTLVKCQQPWITWDKESRESVKVWLNDNKTKHLITMHIFRGILCRKEFCGSWINYLQRDFPSQQISVYVGIWSTLKCTPFKGISYKGWPFLSPYALIPWSCDLTL